MILKYIHDDALGSFDYPCRVSVDWGTGSVEITVYLLHATYSSFFIRGNFFCLLGGGIDSSKPGFGDGGVYRECIAADSRSRIGDDVYVYLQ